MPRTSQVNFMSAEAWPPAVTFFAVLSLYAATMYPDVTGGDAPELVSAAVLGGVAHPPGYPTFNPRGPLLTSDTPQSNSVYPASHVASQICQFILKYLWRFSIMILFKVLK